jgi:hypothetical protein
MYECVTTSLAMHSMQYMTASTSFSMMLLCYSINYKWTPHPARSWDPNNKWMVSKNQPIVLLCDTLQLSMQKIPVLTTVLHKAPDRSYYECPCAFPNNLVEGIGKALGFGHS